MRNIKLKAGKLTAIPLLEQLTHGKEKSTQDTLWTMNHNGLDNGWMEKINNLLECLIKCKNLQSDNFTKTKKNI